MTRCAVTARGGRHLRRPEPVAGGFGQARSFECCLGEVAASQLVARYGLGLELRLGRHVVLEGQIAQVHRWNADDDDHRLLASSMIAPRERAVEARGSLAVRF